MADPMQELERLIRYHDFHYLRSDDPRARHKGEQSFLRILELAAKNPKLGNKFWDKYAPRDFRRPLVKASAKQEIIACLLRANRPDLANAIIRDG